MNKPRKSLIKPRTLAFFHQNGCCYYCNQPMWTNNPQQFASKHNITLPQAKCLQCTGEHLIPHQDGGTSAKHNIVAACMSCNQRRHRRKNDLNPEQFKTLVQQRMSKGHWHSFRLNS